MRAMGFVLDCLHSIGEFNTFTNGRMAPKIITTTYVSTTTKYYEELKVLHLPFQIT
jgi:hypothetical protein